LTDLVCWDMSIRSANGRAKREGENEAKPEGEIKLWNDNKVEDTNQWDDLDHPFKRPLAAMVCET
jgi:hypothetical protein